MKRFPAILGRLYNTPHCILPSKLEEIAAFVRAHSYGPVTDRVVAEPRPDYCVAASSGEQAAIDQVNATAAGESFVAVMPLFGTMQQHASLEMEYSGGTSTEMFGRQFMRLCANDSVKTVVIESHTPGGQVWGTGELSDLIFAARGQGTRIVTVVNSLCASAGLWVATAADEVYVTPGGEMGSVGACRMHCDISKWEEKEGYKTTLIASPAKKVAGNEFEPLDEATAAEMKLRTEQTLARFTAALARNRGVSEEHVATQFGGGGMLRADECVKAKLADGIATFREILGVEVEKLRSTTPAGRGSSARANARALSLADAEE